MAHTASTGSAKRTVDVIGKRLGIKRFGGQYVKSGEIILRQRGSEFYPGLNTKEGRDFTIFAVKEGFVSFRRMNGYKRKQKFVDILPIQTKELELKELETPVVKAEMKLAEIKKKVVSKDTSKSEEKSSKADKKVSETKTKKPAKTVK